MKLGIGACLNQPYWYWHAEMVKRNQWLWRFAAGAGRSSRLKWEPTRQIIEHQRAMAARTV